MVKSWAYIGEVGPPFIIGDQAGNLWTSLNNGVTWSIAETLTGGPTINANAITKIGTAYIIGTNANTFYRATSKMEGFVNSFSGGGFNQSIINGAGLYLVGRNQLNPIYWSTPDLVTFTSRTAPFIGGNVIQPNALSYTGSYFVAGSSGNNTPTISRSLDGISWQDTGPLAMVPEPPRVARPCNTWAGGISRTFLGKGSTQALILSPGAGSMLFLNLSMNTLLMV